MAAFTPRAACVAACLLGCAAAHAGCDDGGSAGATTGARVSCIYGGSPAPGALGLGPDEVNALADLEIAAGGADDAFRARCSGLLINDGWVLTAAHCTSDPASTRVTVRLGPPASCGESERGEIASAGVVTHPSLDLMLVRLAETPAARGIDATPVPPDASEDVRPGAPVQLAGFGRTEESLAGQLRFATEDVSAVDDTWLEVDGRGASGACVADSGGPLLVRDAGGVLRTLGALSVGSTNCVGTDRYVRLRAALDWLRTVE